MYSKGASEHYPLGAPFVLDFGNCRMTVHLIAQDRLGFVVGDGSYSRSEEVRVDVACLRPGLFLLNWKEASGAMAVHVHDFEHRVAHVRLQDAGGKVHVRRLEMKSIASRA